MLAKKERTKSSKLQTKKSVLNDASFDYSPLDHAKAAISLNIDIILNFYYFYTLKTFLIIKNIFY